MPADGFGRILASRRKAHTEALPSSPNSPAVSAIPYKPLEPHDSHFWEYQAEGTRILARQTQARKAAKTQAAARTDGVETDRVGTGAFARPAQAKPTASVGTTPRPSRSRSDRAPARHNHDHQSHLAPRRSLTPQLQKAPRDGSLSSAGAKD